MTEKLIQKFIENNVSSLEREQVLLWIKESEENQKRYSQLKAVHVAKTLENSKEITPSAYTSFSKRRQRKSNLRYIPYAAIMIIALTLGYVFITQNKLSEAQQNTELATQTIINTSNTTKTVQLPDGSTVTLQLDSKLVFPNTFNDSIRSVTLIGEGLFDIVHNEQKPFIVKTEDFNVKVLGTVFNVKSYQNDMQTETTLLSGKVELVSKETASIILAPSQKAIFKKEKKEIEVEKVKEEDIAAWKKGAIVFNSTPMQQVALDLERKYNVNIHIKSAHLLQYEYTGTFNNLTIEEILKLLTISSPIHYSKTDQDIYLTTTQ